MQGDRCKIPDGLHPKEVDSAPTGTKANSTSLELGDNVHLAGLFTKLAQDAERAAPYVEGFLGMHVGRGIEEYLSWITEKLRTSGLAQLIPGGIDAFPDIYAQMPWWQRSIEVTRRPRSFVQLLEHLYEYLEWYVDPARPVPRPRYWYYLILLACLSPLLILLGYMIVTLYTGAGLIPWVRLAAATCTFVCSGLALVLFLGRARLSFAERQCFPYVNKVALYKYLSSTYAAQPDRDPL